MENLQKDIKTLLDSYFQPLLKEEWKSQLSIFEAGAIPDENGKIRTIIIWVRSTDIVTHVRELLEQDHVCIDTVQRECIEPGHPRQKDETLMVRLRNPIYGQDLQEILVEVFQVFSDEDESIHKLSELESICS